jgi:DNA invertase Pin-like site-specific DNA recombinase
MSLARAVDLRPEDLAGRRWAGYIRESTRGQADRYGPDLQRAEQERFADRYGLRPAGLEYLDLVSGKDTLRRSDFARMVADAETGRFDVLLCYDTSRFARNVADAWSYRDRLARAGVVVVFCADTLISGNVDTYELEGLKTVSDAAYIRRLSRNVARGYEQKWRLFADPGGHPPLGFARIGARQLLAPVDGPDLDRVRRAFSLYAAGTWSDTTLGDELGLTEPGLAEILTNPLYAGRAIRHKGRPDEEERPTTFAAPVEPALFERVAQLRAQRRTRHGGGSGFPRRSYPLLRLLHCADCESPYHGDANAGRRRVRHTRRPHCGRFASFRPELVEEQVAGLMDGVRLSDDDLDQVFRAMRRGTAVPVAPDPGLLRTARADLQRRLGDGEIGLAAFNREWRVLDRPMILSEATPDRERLVRARDTLADFGSLWRDVAVPDVLREGAATEIFERLDVRGSELVAVHPRPNENAWLLGWANREKLELVGARGIAPPELSDLSPSC